nr:hypothetical protein GCM10020092_096750 [Actinoplanes digitatis]
MLSTARLNSALIVTFVGAFTAIIAVGRTMGGPTAAEPEPETGTGPETEAVADPDEIERDARAEEPQTVPSGKDD